MHFRIASVGGVSRELCHPFPVLAEANAISGRLKGGALLFHNGHWSGWKDALLRSLTSDGRSQLPAGVWSDSRAMALLAHRHGLGLLSLIEGQRIALLTKSGVQRLGGSWTQADGIWLSNTHGLNVVVNAPLVGDWRTEGPKLVGANGQRYLPQQGAASRIGGGPRFLTREAEALDRAINGGDLDALEDAELEREYSAQDADEEAADEEQQLRFADDGEAEHVEAVARNRAARRRPKVSLRHS